MKSLLINLRDKFVGKAPLGAKRSSQWTKVRNEFLEKHPKCYVCESTSKLEVHHILPFHLNPEHELDTDNLITLCENTKYGINCHLLVGHRGNYSKYNPHCREDAELWRKKIKSP